MDQVTDLANRFATMPEMIGYWAGQTPGAHAILGPGRPAVTYGHLWSAMAEIVDRLRRSGIGPRDTVAVALPQDVDGAVMLLGVMAGAVAAPVDGHGSESGLARAFAELGVRAVVSAGHGAASAAAQVRGIEAIVFDRDHPAASHDVLDATDGDGGAILLRTSGTTAAPKQVLRTHRMTHHVLRGFCRWHGLTADDRAVVMGPLYHNSTIHAALLAPLFVGGAVVIPQGLGIAAIVAAWSEHTGTYGSIVPTRLRGLLNQVRRQPDALRGLRFLRCSAAALGVDLQAEAEALLGVPVVQAWGMTEVGSCVLSNPLPPGERKPGTVGLPVQPEVDVAIMDENGQTVPDGVEGELVVRGPVVSIQEMEAGGWFRTGDTAVRDADGYVALRGRIKEMINRGGVKIHPLEIDAAAQSCPGVAEAASFAMAHPTLGEAIGLAVVAKAGVDLDGSAIRADLATRLERVKVPQQVYVVDAIAKTATGKVDRTALARSCAFDPAEVAEIKGSVPATALEREVATLWAGALGRDTVPLDSDFFFLGGDSLSATQVILDVEARFGVSLSAQTMLVEANTVRGMASRIDRLRGQAKSVDGTPGSPDFVGLVGPGAAGGMAAITVLDPVSLVRRGKPNALRGTIAFNALGFRSPDISIAKPPGTVRLAFLGSSTTFDAHVGGNDRTWPHHVWSRLAPRCPGVALDYLNAALPGHNTRHITAMLRHHVLPLRPDVVVIRANDMNADSAYAAREQGRYDGVHYRPSLCAKRFATWAWFEKNLTVARRLATAAIGLGKARLDVGSLPLAFEARLRDLVNLARSEGAVVVLVAGGGRLQPGLPLWRQIPRAASHVLFMPYLSIAETVALRDAYRAAVKRVAAEAGAVVIDVSDIVPNDRRHYVDSNHFSPAGSAHLGTAVAEALVTEPSVRHLLAR